MNQEMTALIEKLSAKLGVTAEYLWGVLIRQAPIDAASSLFVASCVIIAAIFAWRKILSIDDDFDRTPAMFIGGVVSLIALVFVSVLVTGAITAFINPEYWALKQIIK